MSSNRKRKFQDSLKINLLDGCNKRKEFMIDRIQVPWNSSCVEINQTDYPLITEDVIESIKDISLLTKNQQLFSTKHLSACMSLASFIGDHDTAVVLSDLVEARGREEQKKTENDKK